MFPVLVVLFIIGLVSFNVVSATAPFHIYTYCPNTAFFRSALPAKYDTLLFNLSAAANVSSTPGFYNTTVGSPEVYGLYMCRGDDDGDTCRDCVAAAAKELSLNCPRGQQAVTWYDECMIRYSNAPFFSQLDDNFQLLMLNTNNFTGNLTHTNEVLFAAFDKVATNAAEGTSKFWTEQDRLNDFQTVYVLGQCTPDLSPSDCNTCLQQCANSLGMPEWNSQGGRALDFSCNLRYEIYQFYHSLSSTQVPIHTYCPDSDFFSTEQAVSYNATIAKLLNNLSSTANMSPTPGFYNTTIGVSPTLYGLYLCRGDVLAATCGDCVAAASTYLPKNCTGRKQAVVLYDLCMIRYSTNYFFGLLDNEPLFNHTTPRNGSGPSSSNWGSVGVSVQKAADNVTSAATEQGASTVKKMATHQENVAGTNYTVYMLAQCTPDLSVNDCISCLKNSVNTLDMCCADEQGGVVYYFSCNLRFEMYQFYIDPTAQSDPIVVFPTTNSTTGSSPSAPSHNTKSTNKSKQCTLLITGSVITGVVLLLIGLGLLFQMYVRIKLKSAYPADFSDIMTVEALQMDFNTIRAATQNFSIDNKLGQGGFGPVYKGKLESGQEIAVKRLSDNSGQGIVEFKTEVIIVAKLQHRNLVKLLGFCVTGIERILVYEFLPNTSLDKFLSGTFFVIP